jgi:hypothetical protein
MNLLSTDPYTVAKAFFEQMHHYDSLFQEQSTTEPQNEAELMEDTDNEEKSKSEDSKKVQSVFGSSVRPFR